MDYKQKSEEFRVSIRRKNLSEKMAVLRARQTEGEGLHNSHSSVQHISALLASTDRMILYRGLEEVRLASQDPQVMEILKSNFELFYTCILEVDSVMAKENKEVVERAFSDLATILINVTSEELIILNQEPSTDIATPLLNYLHRPQREISTLWLVSNLLYRHNRLSQHFMRAFVHWGGMNYLRERVNIAFASDSEMTIFYYFVGAFAANLDSLSFVEYREGLTVIEGLSQMQLEELYWYLLDGLIEHAPYLSVYDYQLFGTKLLAKCQGYCKAKKTRFVLKYLQFVSRLLQGDSQQAYQAPEESRKKLLANQYQRLKKHLVLRNLQFCLENRSPQVKKLLFEIGYMLVALYLKEIRLLQEYFYLTLAQEIRNAERLEQTASIWFLKYFRVLLSSLLFDKALTSSKQHTELFIKFIEETSFFQRINFFMQKFSKSPELLSIAMDVLAFLLEYDIPSVNAAMRRVKLIPTLQGLSVEAMEVMTKRDRLLDVLGDESL